MGLFSKIFGKKNVVERQDEPDMVRVAHEDEGMNWAIEKAKLTLWYFATCLQNPQPHQSYFSVKVKIIDGDNLEHIWLTDPHFDEEGHLFGTVSNEPVEVKTVKMNQKIGIDREHISDWMIVEHGRLIGGYTIRAIRNNIPDSDKPNFDQSIGLYIDEGVDHFKPNFDTPEGAILAIEEAYRKEDLGAVLACKDFTAEAKVMMAKMSIEPNEETTKGLADVLEASFINSINEYGFPNFNGITCAFPAREKVTEQHWIITEVCWYADGGKSVQKINVANTANGWSVLNPVSDDE